MAETVLDKKTKLSKALPEPPPEIYIRIDRVLRILSITPHGAISKDAAEEIQEILRRPGRPSGGPAAETVARVCGILELYGWQHCPGSPFLDKSQVFPGLNNKEVLDMSARMKKQDPPKEG